MRKRLLDRLLRRREQCRTKAGQAIVEMALAIMLLLTLTFGTADIGLFMYDYVQAANCVREAARRASVRAADAASPPYCVDSDLIPVVPAGYQDFPAGSEVNVTLTKAHEWIVICHLVPGMSCTYNITTRTSMRMEGREL
jgi:hypothetical protein